MSDNMAVLEDGTILIEQRPSRFVMEHPTYAQWLKFLLSRDAAETHTQGERQVIKTITYQPARLIDGKILIKCIGCGIGHRQMDMSKIVIGGLVRMPEEEETGPNEITRKVVLKPVSKSGLGCPVCAIKFQESVQATALENKLRENLANATAKLADVIAQGTYKAEGVGFEKRECPKHPSMRGFCSCLTAGRRVAPMDKPKGLSKLTPWIDVFDVANGYTMEA